MWRHGVCAGTGCPRPRQARRWCTHEPVTPDSGCSQGLELPTCLAGGDQQLAVPHLHVVLAVGVLLQGGTAWGTPWYARGDMRQEQWVRRQVMRSVQRALPTTQPHLQLAGIHSAGRGAQVVRPDIAVQLAASKVVAPQCHAPRRDGE